MGDVITCKAAARREDKRNHATISLDRAPKLYTVQHWYTMDYELHTVAEPTVGVAGTAATSHKGILVVYLDGPNPTRVIQLPDGADVSFGRSRGCTIHIDSESVSRTHARLRRNGFSLTLEDAGSRNGTWLNGDKISQPRSVVSGDEIRVGPATALVSMVLPAGRSVTVGSTSHLEERLAAEADRSVRYRRRFALALVHLTGSDDVVDTALSRVAQQLRTMDGIAEYSPDVFAIVMPEYDAAAAEVAVNDILTDLNDHVRGVEVCAGLAAFPGHSSKTGELLALAFSCARSASPGAVNVAAVSKTTAMAGNDDLVIGSPAMGRVYAMAERVAPSNMTVLVMGETGAGKEVVAEHIHRHSKRQSKPFIRLNCTSIPDSLLESELFGHEKGAFTGADRRRIGYFEAADGGTIFLDEIGEISQGTQAKLLRVLEQRTITRVGGTREIAVDVRVVCATNRDLEQCVGNQTFREDLFFRISAFTVIVPPLRDRTDEIEGLANLFLAQTVANSEASRPQLSPQALEAMHHYSWPGNVRELKNAMERAAIVQETGVIETSHLPQRIMEKSPHSSRSASPGDSNIVADVKEHMAELECRAIVAALEACGGNQTQAAKQLGLSRRALIYKLEKYGLKKPPASRR